MVKLPVTGQPGIDSRLPRSGSLSPVTPENFVFATHAFCRNSNWRETLAFRQMKCNARGDSLGEAGASAFFGASSSPYSAPRREQEIIIAISGAFLYFLACVILIDGILSAICRLAFFPPVRVLVRT